MGNYYGNDAASTYNAFEVKVDKRFSQGLQFLTHYTYSHANNYTDQYYAINHDIAWGPVDFNRNQVFVVNTVYELPFGKGKKYARTTSVGRWTICRRVAVEQHHQLEQRLAVDAEHQRVRRFFDGKTSSAVRIRGLGRLHTWRRFAGSSRTHAHLFHPVARIIDPDDFPVGTDVCGLAGTASGPFALPGCGSIGDFGRNSYHGPSGFYSDLSVSKAFAITERFRAKFVTDFFNMFNHPVYAFSANNGANGVRGLLRAATTARSPVWRAARTCVRFSSRCGSTSKDLQAL